MSRKPICKWRVQYPMLPLIALQFLAFQFHTAAMIFPPLRRRFTRKCRPFLASVSKKWSTAMRTRLGGCSCGLRAEFKQQKRVELATHALCSYIVAFFALYDIVELLASLSNQRLVVNNVTMSYMTMAIASNTSHVIVPDCNAVEIRVRRH